MRENKWEVDPNGTCESHWIDLIHNHDTYEDNKLYCWKYAQVKWDGCIHFYQAGNIPFSKEYGMHNTKRDQSACDDYIHICDIDEFIKILISLKEKSKEHFKDEEYWKNIS